MNLADFDFELPLELIAQEPAPQRTGSRLLVVERHGARLSHHAFPDLLSLLPADCLLVLNDTRVFAARLRGRKPSGGNVEVLLLRCVTQTQDTWEVLCKGAQRMGTGGRLYFGPALSGQWLTAPEAGRGVLRFESLDSVPAVLERVGETPLPPYIRRPPGGVRSDDERYQTVYARHSGAVAAPTAGLHFTEDLLASLRQRGVETVFLTLHVGAGTFQPIRVQQVEAHTMEEEGYEITPPVAERINAAKRAGRTIIAVGTTSTRALESAARADGQIEAGRRCTDLFIYPGYRFRIIDALITNFHLPRSSLLLLVSAFAGRERTLSAYAEAVAQRYRFYSYGDAMLIV